MTHVFASQNEMSNGLEKHPTTIEYHLKKLLENGVIRTAEPVDGFLHLDFKPHVIACEPIGKEIIYVLKDPYVIYDTLIAYEHSLIDDEIGKLALDLIDYLITDGVPETVKNPKDILDSAFEAFYEIFPHPYHV